MWSHGCWAAVDWQWHVARGPPSTHLIVPKQEFRRQPFELETANTHPPEKGDSLGGPAYLDTAQTQEESSGSGPGGSLCQGPRPHSGGPGHGPSNLEPWSFLLSAQLWEGQATDPLSPSWGNLFSGWTPVDPTARPPSLSLWKKIRALCPFSQESSLPSPLFN